MSDVVFLHAEGHEDFLQINSMVLIGMVKHSQSSQSSKFALSLQYLKQEVDFDEIDFLHADRHQSLLQHFGGQNFLQDDTIIIDGHDQAFSK